MEGGKYLKAFANLNYDQKVALTFPTGTKSELMQLLASLQKVVCIHEVWVYKEAIRAPPYVILSHSQEQCPCFLNSDQDLAEFSTQAPTLNDF